MTRALYRLGRLAVRRRRRVVTGIASTARVITSAALIMICVFLGFVFGEDPVIKMMGLGLATAVLVDATLVRVVLVPASSSRTSTSRAARASPIPSRASAHPGRAHPRLTSLAPGSLGALGEVTS